MQLYKSPFLSSLSEYMLWGVCKSGRFSNSTVIHPSS